MAVKKRFPFTGISLISVALYLFLICINTTSHAQQSELLRFDLINGNDGLSQGLVTQVVQDKKGFMWFATNDGLNKYDGYDFTTYRHNAKDPNSISDDAIRSIFEDSKGRFWIGTAFKGLSLFDREHGRFYQIPHHPIGKVSMNEIRSIGEDRSGNLWICTSTGIVRMRITKRSGKSGKNHDFLETHKLIYQEVTVPEWNEKHLPTLNILKNGKIYLTTSGAVWELEASPIQKEGFVFKRRFGYKQPEANAHPLLMKGLQGSALFWVRGTEIVKFDNDSFHNPQIVYKSKHIIKANIIDKNGGLWIEDNGDFARLNTNDGSIETLKTDKSLQQITRNTTAHYCDKTGMIWMGTGGYGIVRYNPDKANFHHLLQGISSYQITSSPQGDIFVNAAAVLKKENNRLVLQEKPLQTKLPDIDLYEPFFAADKQSNFWFISKKGVFQYNGLSGKKALYEMPENGSLQLFPPFLDKQQGLWMSTSLALIRFDIDKKVFSAYPFPGNVSAKGNSFVEGMVDDDNNLLWLATNSGLLRFDKKNHLFINYDFDINNKHSVSASQLFCVCNDPVNPKRYLWVGTKGGGLNQFDKQTGQFIRYTSENGLANNVVYGILPDEAGNLWISTNRGLSRFNLKTKSFLNFTKEDGLQDNEFNRYAFHKKNDTLFFGGLNGINYFVPAHVLSLPAPAVFFSGLKLFNNPVDFTQPGSPITSDIAYTKEVVLHHSQNMVELLFAASDYHKTEDVQYRYKLDGFDTQWIRSGHSHEATYTNLDPGTYQFNVTASNDGIRWSDVTATMTITVIPPWWRTWWFYVLSASATLALFYGIYYYRLQQIIRVQDIRNGFSRDLHDEIGSTLSTINIYAKVGAEQLKLPQNNLVSILEKIRKNAVQAQEAMQDIIWSTNTQNDQFENIINHMRAYAVQLFEVNGYELHFTTHDEIGKVKLDMAKRREFYLIYKEVLNNIAKHANGTEVWIDTIFDAPFIKMEIRDNGNGFDINGLKTGNGLGNMQSRTATLKGKLEINSVPSDGTMVRLKFPVR